MTTISEEPNEYPLQAMLVVLLEYFYFLVHLSTSIKCDVQKGTSLLILLKTVFAELYVAESV